MSDASTVRAGESLLSRPSQLELLAEADDAAVLPAEAYAASEAAGRYTGERFFQRHPELYRIAAKLLARGNESYREIADLVGTTLNTVIGIAWRERLPIESMRERIARDGMLLSQLTQQAAIELLSDAEFRRSLKGGNDLRALLVAHGIAFSNAQLADGRATGRIEIGDTTPPDHGTYLLFIGAAATGLGGDGRGQKEVAEVAEVAPGAASDLVIEVGNTAGEESAPQQTGE